MHRLFNTKVVVGSNQIAKDIEQKAFDLGFGWGTAKSKIHQTGNFNYIYFHSDGKMLHGNDRDVFLKDNFTEVWFEDVMDMPIKEGNQEQDYLEQTIN